MAVVASVGIATGRSQIQRRVSVASSGAEGTHDSSQPSLSNNGRLVAFMSAADNFDPRDAPSPPPGNINGFDVFVRDLRTETTEPVSLAFTKAGFGNRDSFGPSISGDGRSVVFESAASDLVEGDTNDRRDVFVHLLHRHETLLVSVGSGPETAATRGNGHSHVREMAKTRRPNTVVTDDGNLVVFESEADNLVFWDTNDHIDVFVRDLFHRETRLVSVPSTPSALQADGASFNPAISGDGRYVAFSSDATNLVAGDTNASPDVFVHDLTTGQTTRVDVASDGTQASFNEGGCGTHGCHAESISLSDDGTSIAFDSFADNLAPGDMQDEDDVFVHDQLTHATALVNVGVDGQIGAAPVAHQARFQSAMSGNGRFVAFESDRVGLVDDDDNGVVDVYVRDRRGHTTIGVSVAAARAEKCPTLNSGGCSGQPAIDGTGRSVAYLSSASNFVKGDTNKSTDIFLSARTSRLPLLNLRLPFGVAPANETSSATRRLSASGEVRQAQQWWGGRWGGRPGRWIGHARTGRWPLRCAAGGRAERSRRRCLRSPVTAADHVIRSTLRS